MRIQLAALATVPFIMVLGNSMLIPVLPQIGTALKLDQARVGLLITAFSLPAGLTIPWAGMLSDRVGRVTVIAPALLLYGLGGLGAGLVAALAPHPFTPILVARAVQGVGAGGTYQLALALAGDVFQSRERSKALGLLEAANGLGKVVSPVAGAAAALLAWFAPFFVYGLLALPAAALVWYVVRDSRAARRSRPLRAYFAALARAAHRKALPLGAAFLAGMVCLFLLFGVLANLSDTLERRFGVGGFTRGLVISLPVLGLAVTAYVAGTALQHRLARRARAAVICGLGLAAVGTGLLPWLEEAWLWTASATALGLGVGLALPSLNTLITSSVPFAGRGLVTALYGAVRFLGVALGPPVFGMVGHWGAKPTYLGGVAVAVLALVVTVLYLDGHALLDEEDSGLRREGTADKAATGDEREPPVCLDLPRPVKSSPRKADAPATWWRGGDPF